MRDTSGGILVFDANASVQHVDPLAADRLNTTPGALLDGTASTRIHPVDPSGDSGGCSLRSLVQDVLDDPTATRLMETTDGGRIEIRCTDCASGTRGAIALLYPPSQAEPVSSESHSPSQNDVRSTQTDLLERISRGHSLADVLEALVCAVEDNRPGMLGSILLYDADAGTLRHGAAPSLPDTYVQAIDGESIGPTAGSCGTAVYVDDTVISEDIERDERWAGYREVARANDLRACWSTPIHGEDGQILGTFALYYDEPRAPSLADRRLIEDASYLASIAIEHDRQKQQLQIQSEQIRRLVENAQPVVFFLDADGTVLIAEGEDLRSLGLEPEDVVGQSIYDLYGDHSILLGYIDQALSGQSVDTIIEIDGVTFDAWYAPYYDGTGAIAGCIGMAVDITEQQDAQAALREHRDVLRRTQEMAHVGGWEYDPATDHMTGTEQTYRICEVPLDAELSLDQALGLYPPETGSSIRDAAMKCLDEGIPFDQEGQIVTPKGTRKWVRIRGEPRWQGDVVVKMVGTVQDLTERHEIEERLREQKQWLQSITDNISGGIYRSTDQGLVYANQALLDMFGFDTLEDMAASDADERYANPQARVELREREQEEGGLDGLEVEYRRKDGSTFVGLLRSTCVWDDQKGKRYYDGVITDITNQKVREEEIRRQWEHIKSLYAPSDLLLSAGSETEVAARLVGLVSDTFGYPGVVVHLYENGILVPADIPPEQRSTLLDGISFSEDAQMLPATVFRAGEWEIVDDIASVDDEGEYGDYASVASVPLGEYGVLTLANADGGQITHFDIGLIDILARKATIVLARIEQEAHLHASEQRFRGLFEEAALGIALVDANGYIVEVNPEFERLFGRPADDLRQMPLSALSHRSNDARDRSLFDALLRGERDRYEREIRYVRTNNEAFWGRLTVTRHHGPGRAEVLAMVEDISDRKRYEQKLRKAKKEAEEASRLKSNMLANMSHEIRTPLTSIIGFADTLRGNLSGPDARYADLVHESGRRLMRTLDSVLQLSKLEAGSTNPAAEPTDLVTLADDVVALYRGDAESAEVELTFEPGTESLVGAWDGAIVQRILSNLLSNAIKFTPAQGTVCVRVRMDAEHAILDVADTGIGIDETFRPRLFDAFTQESQGLMREHEGAGLGLAIVKRLVDLLDGRIDVESTPDEGTCFTVFLPR